MENWKMVCSLLSKEENSIESVKNLIRSDFGGFNVYPDSINFSCESYFFLAMIQGTKKLVVFKKSDAFLRFTGYETELSEGKAKICELSNENCILIRDIFPFTSPVSHKNRDITIGLGDRLGLASAGHLRLIKDKGIFPVLAQQSIRELNLTGRNYKDVLASASWAVFQEGYTKGFGADGDHLKTADEVKTALDCGFTMITLDCSEHINNNITSLPSPEVERLYLELPEVQRLLLESKYLNKRFELQGNVFIEFSPDEFKKIVLIYLKAIQYTINIYTSVIKSFGRSIDFEMSIDETLTSTSPESHYFVASELICGEVSVSSLAPRFCGEFQKGIDYKGNINEFTKEFDIHVKIARHFGYKISVHSGSDKFTVFPIIGDKTGGKYHLKTAGTNWLEAVRVIAAFAPALYRDMHRFALQNLSEAKKYYHITENLANIPDINTLKDEELPHLMDLNDSRQVLHITYGLILLAKNTDGSFMFKDRIYSVLNEHEAEYYSALYSHIGRHLSELGI